MKFTKTLLALAIASSAAIAPAAFAQSADLSVTGRIFPGACVVELGNGGNADLGDIRLETLQSDMHTVLDDVDLPMSVSCESTVRFALEGVDNTSDTSINAAQYGLGLTPADEKIGSARLGLVDVTMDGEEGHARSSTDGGATWTIDLFPGFAHIGMNSLLGFNTFLGNESPAAIQNLQGTLKVRATIAPTSELTVTEDVLINGNATINLVYL
jgi:type 1 fimbria pilin